MPINAICYRFLQFISVCLFQATITMVDFRLSYWGKDKDAFIRYFVLVSWGNLSTGQKTNHTLNDCKICSSTYRA